jgi:hypothetical protein
MARVTKAQLRAEIDFFAQPLHKAAERLWLDGCMPRMGQAQTHEGGVAYWRTPFGDVSIADVMGAWEREKRISRKAASGDGNVREVTK